MVKLSNKPIKGMLDDFPQDMRLYRWMKNKIDNIAGSNLFEEYDAPVLESIDIFATKSSEELVKEQSYCFTDKGGRELILRPEMTPSLARLVSQKIKEAPKPFRWYSIPKCYRYEQPQKGRIREFRQLNFDLIGDNSVIADWSMLQIVLQIMDSFGVPRDAFEIRINHRAIVTYFLKQSGFSNDLAFAFFKLVDKKDKFAPEAFEASLKQMFSDSQIKVINHYLDVSRLSELTLEAPDIKEYIARFEHFIDALQLNDTVIFSPTTARGLDYYTGLVFEVYGKGESFRRALFGGGRYDHLISDYVNEKVSGIGFGMGLYIFTLFLEELGLLPDDLKPEKTCLIALLDTGDYPFACQVNDLLRDRQYKTEIMLHTGAFKKLFNKAEKKNFEYLTIIGSEEKQTKSIKLKHLKNKTQIEIKLA